MTVARYSNITNIPMSLAVFLATDSYDFEPGVYSATSFLKSIRQSILTGRVDHATVPVDISTQLKSRVGTAIHDGVQKAWETNYQRALRDLGHKQEHIDLIRINPHPDDPVINTIPIYMEQRHHRDLEVNGANFKISGKMDFIANGVLQDFKTTGTFTYTHGTKEDDYQLQGSIYRWLAPHIITADYIQINYIFLDWVPYRLKSEKNYPPTACHSVKIPLLSLDETEAFMQTYLATKMSQQDMPETEITHCTDKELWRRDPVYKYYKNPDKKTRSTKNFDIAADAYARLKDDGNVGEVIEILGEVVACRYCSGIHACTQKDAYLEQGLLKLS